MKLSSLAVVSCILIASHDLHAAGFQLQERSVKGNGRANSGEAAIADDASVLAANAAGIIKLDETSVVSGISFITADLKAHGTAFTPSPVAVSSENAAKEVFVPHFYYSNKLRDKLAIGLGVFTTYGLETDYNDAFASVAITDSSKLTSFVINPTIAYRINDQWSVGAGVQVAYAKAELDGRFGPSQVIDLVGDDWAGGYNIGLLYELSEQTRFGFSYRSQLKFNLSGRGFNLLPPAPVPESLASAPAALPAIIELSGYHEVNSQWAVHSDVTWTQWSTFKDLTATTSGGDTLISNVENWKNTYRFSIGATYKHGDKLTLRAGVAYDETPIPDEAYRTLRIPDGDRIWLSLGASIKLSDTYTLDLGYTHVKSNSSAINEVVNDNGNFIGSTNGHVNVFSIGIDGRF